ncbi:glycosyltransferase family 1 protein [Limnobacter humi]|uniref:Glycosyltransferase family 1 protein n=1 Tax=Limnobacter humi TaxID=1778671 RepID=A0ABT1WI81_9BURK|nr:glycosyltransferase family 1 protein [Limnobacter humi]MCQ8897119.1 glycosyltransferase family 1 protein [Limnobacter humi]
MRILIATDAWAPQINGVVQTLTQLCLQLKSQGHEVQVIHPGFFKTVPCPTYPEIRLAVWPWAGVRKAIDEFKPQAIHIVTEGPIGLAMRLIARARRLPFTTAYHTQFPEYVKARTGIPIRFTARVLRWFHGASRNVMVPTQSVIDTLRERGLTNCVLWQRGVDLSRFNPEPSQAARNLAYNPDASHEDDPVQVEILKTLQSLVIERPAFLYAGRVAVEKNLEAFLSLDLPGEKWVAGDGPAKKQLEKQHPDVRWFGMQNHAALAEIYRQADVFVFPSKTDTFGLVLLEAMACGCPVAAFPVNGPIDVVGQSGAGVLDDNLRTAALAALHIRRSVPRAHAGTFTWAECARQFLEHLAPIEWGPHLKTINKPARLQGKPVRTP